MLPLNLNISQGKTRPDKVFANRRRDKQVGIELVVSIVEVSGVWRWFGGRAFIFSGLRWFILRL